MKEKSDVMRELLKSLISFENKEKSPSLDKNEKINPSEEENVIQDNIFESNQLFKKIRKKIVKI